MTLKGLDEAWGKVDPVTAYNLGYRFIVGYVSEDESKNLSRDDVARIHAAGMAVAFVYEFNPQSALGGYASGQNNAAVALAHFQTLGVPTGVACYNAGTDFNVSPGQMSTCLAHETGFAVTMATKGYRSGAYTGYPFGLYLTQHNYAGFIWQTYAWSNGAWLAAAALRQIQNGVHVAGIDVDIDESEVIDFGQWEETTMLLDEPQQGWLQWAAYRIEAASKGLVMVGGPANGTEEMWLVQAIKELQTEVADIKANMTSTGLNDADKALLQSTMDAVTALDSRLATP